MRSGKYLIDSKAARKIKIKSIFKNIIMIVMGLLLVADTITINYLVKKEREYIPNKTIIRTERIESANYNSKYKLNLVSTYGDDEAYHPKVLNFDKKWNGYKYWMAYTPYPKGNATRENPHIAASNDLANWETPVGLKNPLDEGSVDAKPQQYNSDTHLVYNTNLDRLECYWRYVDDINNEVVIYRRWTKDGINFSNNEEFIKSTDRKKEDYVSPAIIYEDGKYKMWYVDKLTVRYKETTDGKKWTAPVVVDIAYENQDLYTWHIDVIHTAKGYEMLTVAYEYEDNRSTMNLYYTCSKNETKYWKNAVAILVPTTKTSYWDNKGLYRSSMIVEDGVYVVFYSGISAKKNRGIGIVYGKDIENLKEVDINFKNDYNAGEKLNKLIQAEKQQLMEEI